MDSPEHRGDVGRRLLAESIELQRQIAESPIVVERERHTVRTVVLIAAAVLVTLAFAAVVFLVLVG